MFTVRLDAAVPHPATLASVIVILLTAGLDAALRHLATWTNVILTLQFRVRLDTTATAINFAPCSVISTCASGQLAFDSLRRNGERNDDDKGDDRPWLHRAVRKNTIALGIIIRVMRQSAEDKGPGSPNAASGQARAVPPTNARKLRRASNSMPTYSLAPSAGNGDWRLSR